MQLSVYLSGFEIIKMKATFHCQKRTMLSALFQPISNYRGILTCIFFFIEGIQYVFYCFIICKWSLHTFMLQVAHKKLQPNQGKHAQTEHSQDHDIWELFHRLDQGPHDGLQAWIQRRKGVQNEIKFLHKNQKQNTSFPRNACTLSNQWS